jgi:hypothetical protein
MPANNRAQTSQEPAEPTNKIMDAIAYFSKLRADANDYRLREELRANGYTISLPVDEDEDD